MERTFMNISELTKVGFFAGPIRGRVISRTGFKTYDKPGKPGEAEQMSTLILRDLTGEIKIVLFAEIARQLFGEFQLNHCYEIENFKIEKNITPFSGPISLIVTDSTRITFSASESKYMSKIPRNEFSRTLISDTANLKDFDRVNVLGVCVSAGEAFPVSVRGSDRQALLREIWLADESNKRVKVTLWDYEAANIVISQHFPLFFHNLRVKHYNGRLELKSDMGSMGLVNPAGLPEERVRELLAWRDAGGADKPLQTLQAV